MSKSVSNNVFKKKSGIQNIQAYLESGRSITPLEALSNFGIFRLATAIDTLRKRGLNIETEMKKDPNGKTYARYVLGEEKVAEVAPKFNVGDRVRVTTSTQSHWYRAGDEGVVAAQDAYGVDVVFDTGHGATGNPGNTRWWAYADELTLLPAEAPKKELKVGARVRTFAFTGAGEEATVASVYTGGQGYDWRIRCDGVSYTHPVHAHELEVI
jgi:hypothetical protein